MAATLEIEQTILENGDALLARYVRAICLSVLSPVTVISNALLLLTIAKDPLKRFRTPATYFIAALASVDLATGLLVQPCLAVYDLAQYIKPSVLRDKPFYPALLEIGVSLAYVSLNSSFLLATGLIWCQFIAIAFPHHFRIVMTTRKVLLFVGISLVYFTAFILLQFAGISLSVLNQEDMHLHTTLIIILLIVEDICLLRSFHVFNETSRRRLGADAHDHESNGDGRQCATETRPKRRISERQLTVVTLILSVVVMVCCLPRIVVIHINLYSTMKQERVNIEMALIITDGITFIKVALDSFICSWRLKKYRKSLRIVLTGRGNQVIQVTSIRSRDNYTTHRQEYH